MKKYLLVLIAFGFFLAPKAHAAISFDASSTSVYSGSATNTSTITIGSGSNEALFMCFSSGAQTLNSVTVNGLPATLIGGTNAGSRNAWLYFLLNVHAGTANVSSSWSGTTAGGMIDTSLFGVAQLDLSTVTTGSSKTPSSTLSTEDENDWVMDCTGSLQSNTWTPGASQNVVALDIGTTQGTSESYVTSTFATSITNSYSMNTSAVWEEVQAAISPSIPTGISFVQAATSTDNTSAGTNRNICTVTFPASTTTGDLLIVGESAKLSTTSVVSIADDMNDAFNLGIAVSSTANALDGEFWYAKNITGGSSHVTSTYTVGSGTSGLNCVAAEFSGVNTLDITNARSVSTQFISSGSSTNNFVPELIIGAGGTPNNNNALTPGNGFIKVTSSTGSRSILEYMIANYSEPYNAIATQATANTNSMELGGFYNIPTPGNGEGSTIVSTYGLTINGGTFL